MSPVDPIELGRRVRAARAYAGFTSVETLGEQVGISRSTLLKIEHGTRLPKKWELWAIAEVCNVPRSWFTDEWDESEPPTDVDVSDLEAAEEAADELLDDESERGDDQSDERSA